MATYTTEQWGDIEVPFFPHEKIDINYRDLLGNVERRTIQLVAMRIYSIRKQGKQPGYGIYYIDSFRKSYRPADLVKNWLYTHPVLGEDEQDFGKIPTDFVPFF